jgi:hypothetical protein
MQKTKIAFVLLLAVCFMACNNYGKKATKGHVETYYKEGITEEQAQNAANLMYNIDEAAHNAKVEKSFQLIKKNDTVCFRMVVDKAKAEAIGDFSFLAIGNMVSDSVFKGAPVNMDLTNDKFESVKFIPYKKIDLNAIPQ